MDKDEDDCGVQFDDADPRWLKFWMWIQPARKQLGDDRLFALWLENAAERIQAGEA